MKKPSVASFLITTLVLAAVVCIQGEPVKDTYGNPVIAGQQYFVVSLQTENNNGGILSPRINSTEPCPLGIGTSLRSGQPVSFIKVTRPQVELEPIETSSYVNIGFETGIRLCPKYSRWWEVKPSSSDDKEPAIIIGGNAEDKNTWFQIEKERANIYKLTTSTGTVGTILGVGGSQIVLTNDDAKTLFVKFRKVEPRVTTTSTSRVEKLGLRMFPFY